MIGVRCTSSIRGAAACGLLAGILFSAGIFAAGFYTPDPPGEVSAVTTATGIRLEWTSSENTAGYHVYRSIVSTRADPATRVNDAPIQGTAFEDLDVRPGVFFCYTVRAVSRTGMESADSNEACASFRPNVNGMFKRGDANGDGTLNITDSIFTLRHLFLGEFQPDCLDAVDFNDDGTVEITDAIGGLSYLFQGTEPPPAPGPTDCGRDETPDGVELGCSFHICQVLGT